MQIKLPENCTNIRWDSFFKCDKLKIECKWEIKTKLEQFGTINKKSITKKDLENYTSVEGLEINFDAKVHSNSLKNLTDLKMIKCNPEILNKLSLNKYNENNITTLVIQNGTKQLTKEMFKHCLNLEYISIPLSVEKIEEGAFDECKCLRIVECAPIFLNYFNNQYITTFFIKEGIKSIYKDHYKDNKYIQNLIIPNSVKYIEEGALYNSKTVLIFTMWR